MYQPMWKDSVPTGKAERECADRYEVIKEVLSTIGEPFTLLDIGAAQGYFSLRAAEDFDCRVTAIDVDPSINAASTDKVRTYVRKLDTKGLWQMARHDVVLSLSVLHHFPDWRGALAQMRACRKWLIIEVPHPEERWLKHAAARNQLRQIRDAVQEIAVRKLGDFERTGRDGSRHLRPMYLVPGSVDTAEVEVFTGTGTNARLMPRFSGGLAPKLGYKPFPGSLNVRLPEDACLGSPWLDWIGRQGTRRRDYQFWLAWIHKMACHAMVPGKRGHGPDVLEIIASESLRKKMSLEDGNTFSFDFEPMTDLLRLKAHKREYVMWVPPGKIAKCMRNGIPYEKPLLEHIYSRKFTGTIVDAGANIGNHTLWFAAVCGNPVVAFEPVKYRILKRNIHANELTSRVRVEPVGLGDRRTRAAHQGKGRLAPGSGDLPIRKLDSYKLDNVSAIKIDIEGMEPQMLRGAEKTIKSNKPVIYAEQWGRQEHDAIAEVLEPWGYKMANEFTSEISPTPVGEWVPE